LNLGINKGFILYVEKLTIFLFRKFKKLNYPQVKKWSTTNTDVVLFVLKV